MDTDEIPKTSVNLTAFPTTNNYYHLLNLYSLVMTLVTLRQTQKAFPLVLSPLGAFSPNTHNSLESFKFSQLAKNVVSENFPCAA